MSQTTRIALIGAGGIGNAYVQSAARLGDDGDSMVQIVAVVDQNSEVAAAAASALNAPHYVDLASTLSDPWEVALLCTPPSSHLEMMRTICAAGRRVICEKPLVLDADQYCEIAEQLALGKVTMASKFRFVPDVREARALLSNGGIGTVRHIEVAFGGVVDMTARWNSDPTISGGGVLADNGPHAFDLVRQLGGPIRELQAYVAPNDQDLEVEDNVHVVGTTLQNSHFSIRLSWSLHWDLPYFARALGTAGGVELGWREMRIREGNASWRSQGTGYDKFVALGGQLREAQTLANGSGLEVGPAEAKHTVDAVSAAYASLRSGRVESLANSKESASL